LKLTILGCYAATPTFTNPTSQILEIKNRLFLIDCGEGTQVQLRKIKSDFLKLIIFLFRICTRSLWVDRSSVYVYIIKSEYRFTHSWPKGIKEIIKLQLRLANSWSNYGLHFHELESNERKLFLRMMSFEQYPLKHRIYTNGFLFEEKIDKRKLNTNAVQNYEIDKCYFQNIKTVKMLP
jgi:ribonuclease Z